jgi:hypothetical protein
MDESDVGCCGRTEFNWSVVGLLSRTVATSGREIINGPTAAFYGGCELGYYTYLQRPPLMVILQLPVNKCNSSGMMEKNVTYVFPLSTTFIWPKVSGYVFYFLSQV